MFGSPVRARFNRSLWGTPRLDACRHGKSTDRTSERGIVLVSVLVVSTMLLVAGIIGARTARVELKIAGNELKALKALGVAEAGLTHAVKLIEAGGGNLSDELDRQGTGGALTQLGSPVTVSGVDYRFRSYAGRASDDGYYVHARDNFDETAALDDPTTDVDQQIRVVSRGKVGDAERIVEAVVWARPVPDVGLFGDLYVTFGGGAEFDTYNSDNGDYPNGPGDEGAIGSNGDIGLNGFGTTVNGDARAGGAVEEGSGTITGDQFEDEDPVTLDPVDPCGPPYSDGTGIKGGNYNAATGELRTQGKNPDIILAAGEYCFSSVTLSGNNTLTVQGDVVTYLTDKSSFEGGGIVNEGLPKSFMIFSSYAGTGEGVKIAGGSDVKAAVHAPYAEVKITGDGDFYGTVTGLQIDVPGGAKFHYDVSLGGPGLHVFSLNRWRELRGF